MAPLSFVYSDGTAECHNLNRKIVRSHVAKHFRPKKKGQQSQQLENVGRSEPRLIAPNHPRLYPVGKSSYTLVGDRDDSDGQSLQIRAPNEKPSSQHSLPASSTDATKSEDEVNDVSEGDFEPQGGENANQIAPTAVMGLLGSGASKGKNLRIGWMKEGTECQGIRIL
jgi:hypothetical protein